MGQIYRWLLSLFAPRRRGELTPSLPPPPLFPRSFQREENDRQDVPGLPYQSLELDEYGGIVSFVVRTPFFFTPEEITARDNAAIVASQQVKGQTNVTAQRANAGLNLYVINGQSEVGGNQTAPAITLSQPLDVMMIGHSPRPLNAAGYGVHMGEFVPVGDSNLHPAIGANQNGVTGVLVTPLQGGFSNISHVAFTPGGRTIDFTGSTGTMIELVDGSFVSTQMGAAGQPAFDLTQLLAVGRHINFTGPGAYAMLNGHQYLIESLTETSITITSVNLPPWLPGAPTDSVNIYLTNNNSYLGEESGVSKITMLRDLQLTRRSTTTATDDLKPVIINVALGGNGIGNFAKDHKWPIYNRPLAAAAIITAIAEATNKTWCVAEISFHQGGSDIATPGQTYSENLISFATGQQGDLMALSGQARLPLFMLAQQSGKNLPDYDNNGLAMSQLNFALNPPNSDCYCYGPMYFVTDQGDMGGSPHWLPNSEVWAGSLEAKITYKILEAGEGWLPLHWKLVETRGTRILLTYHVPEPPLQFQPVFIGTTATSFPDKGFTISDSAGRIWPNAVYFPLRNDGNPASCLVEIDCARSFDRDTLRVVYADAANHRGAGNLSDSCPWLSYAPYRYTDFGGQVPSENIATMVNRKFPLHNWACVQNELISDRLRRTGPEL